MSRRYCATMRSSESKAGANGPGSSTTEPSATEVATFPAMAVIPTPSAISWRRFNIKPSSQKAMPIISPIG